jgi:hypothetical protein
VRVTNDGTKAIAAKGRKEAFQATSNLSQKRAAQASSALSSAMTQKIQAMYRELYESNELKTPEPEAGQIYNCDEIGIEPNGK